MPSYREGPGGAWVEVDANSGEVLRVIEPGQELSEIQPYTAQMPEAVPTHLVAPATTQRVEMRTSYQDRARGFNIKTRWLAIPVAAVAALIAYTGYQVPVLSGTMLTVITCTYMAVWLIAFVWSEWTSPDGVALTHTLAGWRYLRREQRERHRHYRRRERHP